MPVRRPHLDPGAFDDRLVDLEDTAGWDSRTPAERFAEAAGHPADEGAPPRDAVTLRRLASSPVARAGRIPYASNAVFLLELDDADPAEPDQPLRAVYKPARGERPLWDFPSHTLHLREAASYRVDAALGFGLVPPTVLRDGPLGPGSCQLFIHRRSGHLSDDDARRIDAQLRRLAALDALLNNADRKRSHVLVSTPHRLHAIDNALSFLPYPRQRTVLVELSGSPLPSSVARRVVTLAGSTERRSELHTALARMLSPIEVSAFDHRLEELAADPVYPRLDPWDGRPFEWF